MACHWLPMACSDICPTSSPFVAVVASAKSPKQAMAGQTHAHCRVLLDRWGQCASKGSVATGNAMQGPLTAAIGESMLLVADR